MRTLTPIGCSSVQLLIALTLLLAPPTTAQSPPTMVADIGQVYEQYQWAGFLPPTAFVRFGGALYFSFNDELHGTELWRTDLTPQGTRLMFDGCPGACSSNSPSWFAPSAVVGDHLVFISSDGVHGTELFVLDEGAPAPRLLADLRPGLASSFPRSLVASGGLAFFLADDGTGYTLWRTDGTAAGTWRVLPSAKSFPLIPGAPSGLFYVVYAEASAGGGIWWTDGTPGNAVRLYAGWVPSYFGPSGAFAFLNDGTLLFGTRNALWRTDGTVAGTAEVRQFNPPEEYSEFYGFDRVGSEVVFGVNGWSFGNTIWRTDGTPAGTRQIALPDEASPAFFRAQAGTRYFFGVSDPDHGSELWTLDGDTARLVRDIRPGPAGGLVWLWPNGSFFHALGDRLVFLADDGVHGPELWVSDGSAAGTTLVADLEPGPAGLQTEYYGYFLDHEQLGGRLPFLRFRPSHGNELWGTDGSAAGTGPIAPLAWGPSGLQPSEKWDYPFAGPVIPSSCRADLHGRLLFDASDGVAGWEPWLSDGTAAGTFTLGDLTPGRVGSRPANCTALNGRVVFGANPDPDIFTPSLWRTDGTSAGTETVLGPDGSPASLSLTIPWGPLPTLGGFAYYSFGVDLFRTDGASSEHLYTESSSGWCCGGVATGGGLVYFANRHLARTDGTPEGTFSLELPGAEDFFPRALATSGERVFYLASDNNQGNEEPWTSDGTVEGTHRIADLRPGPASSIVVDWTEGLSGQPIAVARGLAFFAADDGVHGEELWVSDGTEEGTHLFDLFPGAYPSSPREITTYGREVFFVAEDPAAGRELWRSDGTVAGTRLVRDLLPGGGSSLPQSLAVVDDRLFFSACLPARGCEPWVFDRSTAGPTWATTFDLAPGALSSSPHDFAFAGGRVYLSAADGTHGFELWSMPARSLFSDGFETGNPLTWSAAAP